MHRTVIKVLQWSLCLQGELRVVVLQVKIVAQGRLLSYGPLPEAMLRFLPTLLVVVTEPTLGTQLSVSWLGGLCLVQCYSAGRGSLCTWSQLCRLCFRVHCIWAAAERGPTRVACSGPRAGLVQGCTLHIYTTRCAFGSHLRAWPKARSQTWNLSWLLQF